MGRRLLIVALVTAGLALGGCGHTSALEGTPWIWSNRWQDHTATAPRPPVAVISAQPYRVAANQTTIAPAAADPPPAEPTLTKVKRKTGKQRASSKQRKHKRR